MKTQEVRIEKGKKVVWNKTTWWWYLSIDGKPQGYFKTKKEAVDKSKELIGTQMQKEVIKVNEIVRLKEEFKTPRCKS